MPSSVCPRLQFCSPQGTDANAGRSTDSDTGSSTSKSMSKHAIQAQRIRLAVFDSRVNDLPTLLAGLQQGVRPFVLNLERDGIQQISEILQLLAIHEITIIAPGFRGGLRLGSTTLTLENLSQYEPHLRAWFSDIEEDPELFLLANNVAQGEAGSEFVEQLSAITGAAVQASKQPVGQGRWLTHTAKTLKPIVLNTYSSTL